MAKKKSVNKKVEKNENSKGVIPLSVRIISIFLYVGFVFGIITGIRLIFTKESLTQMITEDPQFLSSLITQGMTSEQVTQAILVLPMVFMVMGIVFLVVSILGLFVTRGLWKGKNWAKILVIIFSALGALMSLFFLFGGEMISIVYGILGLVVNGAIIWYLGFDKEGKSYFRK